MRIKNYCRIYSDRANIITFQGLLVSKSDLNMHLKQLAFYILFIFFLTSCGRDERPSFIIIYTDDQRADALECAGNASIITPTLDSLCRNGMHFQNAFVTLSICSPSRAALLTGRYGSANGVVGVGLDRKLNTGEITIAGYLKEAGYHTSMIGKWHLGDTPETLGFEESHYFTANGPYYHRTVLDDGEEMIVKGFIEDHIAGKAIDFLDRMEDEYDPFFLFYCTQLPHMDDNFDWEVQPETLAMYENKTIPLPDTFRDSLNNKPAYLKTSRSRERGDLYGYQDEDSLKNHILRYYAAITEMDAALGRMFEKLKSTGLDENTYIIFMGDNGWFLGEHGFTSKVLAYENSIRVPFIISGPEVALENCMELVLNIDIAPTVLELTGLEIPPNLHGKSLLPLLRQEETVWRNDFLYEAPEPQLGSWPIEAVRTREWKYIKTYDIENPALAAFEELYNIREDPEETNNLVHDEFLNNVLNDLRSRLTKLKAEIQGKEGSRQ